MDLLLINNIIQNEQYDIYSLNDYYSYITLGDLQLDNVLNKGLSENHIHANASFNFTVLWQILMYNNIEKCKINNILISESTNHLFEENLYIFIQFNKLIRNLILFFLKYNNHNNILDYYNNTELNSVVNYVLDKMDIEKLTVNDENIILDNIERMNSYYDITNDNEFNDLTFKLFMKYRGVKTYGENIFLFESLKYIKKTDDFIFKKIFMLYIRIKNEFYRNVAFSNEINGLENFQHFFSNSTSILNLLKLSDKDYFKLMIRTLFQDKYIKKIELRFSLSNTKEKQMKFIKDFMNAYKEVIDEDYLVNKELLDYPRLGLIFHLIKEKDPYPNEKCWISFNKENEKTYHNLAYGSLQKKYIKQISNLIKIRNEIPQLSYFILGIDAANLENNTPIDVFAPVFQYSRDSTKDKRIELDRNGNLINIKSLYFTFHAGEDFRHIISGLRRIDEVINHCKFHSGDRIGHGTALGINIEKWGSENPVVIMPRIEHLNNLLWIWNLYSSFEYSNTQIILYLEKEIYKTSKEIYSNNIGITTSMLYENYINSFKALDNDYLDENLKIKNNTDISEVGKLEFCSKINDSSQVWTLERLNFAKHCRCFLEKMNEAIYVSVKNIDLEIINDMQKIILKEIANKGIVIEVNPTSNTNIGAIDTIFENQAFVINKIDNNDYSNVIMTINSDDPMIFNTTLSNEYAYLYYALIKKGYSKENILLWIDKIRVSSMETSFIDNKLTNQQYYEYIVDIIKYFD